jgi:cell division GTPase FtsZ
VIQKCNILKLACLFNLLSNLGKDFTIIFSIPFDFEGPDRVNFATDVKKELQAKNNVRFFHLEELRKDAPNLTLGEGFIKANERFYKILLDIIEVH